MQIEARPGLTLKLDQAYASAINLSAYSDDFQFRSIIDSIRVGDVVHIVGWTLRLRNPQGETWDGGDGQQHDTQRGVVLNVLKLQVNDEKKFGNWTDETNVFSPQ